MKFDLERDVKEELQSRLLDYLRRQNVEVMENGSHKFRCIKPEHEDKNPSANIIPGTNEREWNCHVCSAHGDIFTAAHYLENKPLDGPGFVEENVRYLADLYHINIPKTQMTEEESKRWRARHAYRIALQYMLDTKEYSDEYNNEITKREWKADRVKAFGVGQVKSYPDFKAFMLKQDGYSFEFLQQIDLLGPRAEWMFNDKRMLFVLLDEFGRPCGFAARNLNYVKEDPVTGENQPNGPKYRNTSSIGLYSKSRLLYNAYEAKKHREGRIFLVEGQADVVALRLAGLDNVVALCGTALTDEHIVLMRNLGMTQIVITLDSDKAGQKKTGEMIDHLSEYPSMKVEVLTLPANAEESDPDSFIRKNGAEAWISAQEEIVSGFKWQLQTRPREEDKYTTLERTVKSVVSVDSPLQIHRMCEELSVELDIPLEVIREEVSTRRNTGKAQQEAELLAYGNSVKRQIERNPGSLPSILAKAQNYLAVINKKSKADPLASADQVTKMVEHISKEEEIADSKGILLGWPEFDKRMFGIPPNDTWIVLGGKANAGKTSMCGNMVYNALKENDDVMAIIYTIDDSYGRFLPRLISAHTGIKTSWVSKRKVLEKKHPGTIQKVKDGYEFFIDLIQKGRLLIWDIRDGNTWAFANLQLAKLRQENPKTKILMILDNFHLLKDFSEMGESTEKFSRLSNMVANSVKEHEIALISTVEYHKLKKKQRPENQSIHRTQQLEYDAHLILHLINYEDEFGPEKNKVFWLSNTDTDVSIKQDTGERVQVKKRKPVVELAVGKSKLEEFKHSIYYRFDPARCFFQECREAEMAKFRSIHSPWMSFSKAPQ